MDARESMSRRTVLGLVAAGALAGCGGMLRDDTGTGPDDDEATPGTATATPTPSEPGPGGLDENGSDAGDTSLAGSCAAAFGDTDRRYDPGDRDVVTTFAYPLAGEVVGETDGSDGHTTVVDYGDGEGPTLQRLVVTERGPLDVPADVGASYVETDDEWEAAGTVTFDGSTRTVAARRRDDGLAHLWGFEGPDGTYSVEIECSAVDGEPCPDAYEAVCRRVSASVERR
jgi:hypothetical protein